MPMDDDLKKQWFIYKTTWSAEDQLEQLERILDEASIVNVESRLVDYVKENIEPIGWTAMLKSDGTSSHLCPLLKKPINLIVDVINVSQEVLEASVVIKQVADKTSAIDDEAKTHHLEMIHQEVDVPIQQLYPLAEQENKCIDIAITAEVLDQVRFFYDYIFRPWDRFAESCIYDSRTLLTRMKLHEAIMSEDLSPRIVAQMEQILNEARRIQHQITKIENETQETVDEFQIIELSKLHKKMNVFSNNFDNLTDPTKRILAAHQQQIERVDLLNVTLTDGAKDVFVVADGVPIEVFVSCLTELPLYLKQFSNISEDAIIRSFPSLQTALDSAITGTTVFCLSGSHPIKQLGALSYGGTICGLKENVIIEGSFHTGDSVFDLTMTDSSFHLKNVCVKPLNDQVAFRIHSGSLHLDQCTFEDCSVGVILLGVSKCRATDCRFVNVSSHSFYCKSKSKLQIENCSFKDCFNSTYKTDEEAYVCIDGEDLQN